MFKTSTIGLASTDKPCSKAVMVKPSKGSRTNLEDGCDEMNLGKSE